MRDENKVVLAVAATVFVVAVLLGIGASILLKRAGLMFWR